MGWQTVQAYLINYVGSLTGLSIWMKEGKLGAVATPELVSLLDPWLILRQRSEGHHRL